MAKKFRYKHISSVVEDRVPESLLDGEIAVNRFAGKEKLFIKNSEGDIVPFIPEHEITVLSANVKTLAIATAEDINELSATTSELGEGISANTQNIERLSASTVEIESGLNQLSAATEDEIERALSAETFLQEQITEVSGNLDTLAIAVTEDVNELSGTVKSFIIAATEDIDELSASTSQNIEELSASTVLIDSKLSTLSSSTEEIKSDVETLSASTIQIDENLNTFAIATVKDINELSATTSGLSFNIEVLSGNVDTLANATIKEFNEVYNNLDDIEKEIGVYYKKQPLTFNILSAGTINWIASYESFTKTISYSKDNGTTWTDIVSSTAGTSFNVNAGDNVMFKGDNAAYAYVDENDNYFWNHFDSTAVFEVEGNIMSLIDSTGYTTATTLSSAYTFAFLFQDFTGLTSAENLILPATTLANDCYECLFGGCTSLTSAPSILPATTLTTDCYNNMFGGCTSLTTAPELPATTLAPYCYQSMFSNCSSLTTAPELPATTLANWCYQSMFSNCSSLTTAPELPATSLGDYCYESLFGGCTSLTSAPSILPATTLTEACYGAMFYECTNLATAPELPATSLTDWCYGGMFEGCTNLNYIKCLATDISASNCTSNWVNGVSATGTFVKAPSMTGWTTGNNGIPTNWVVEDNLTLEDVNKKLEDCDYVVTSAINDLNDKIGDIESILATI